MLLLFLMTGVNLLDAVIFQVQDFCCTTHQLNLEQILMLYCMRQVHHGTFSSHNAWREHLWGFRGMVIAIPG